MQSVTSQKPLKLGLYSGIALVVISILFLGREQESMSFLARTVSAILIPMLFYGLGGLVIRYLKAPLAGPGIIATGAWLIVVGLIHLWDQGDMPDLIRPFYWGIASVSAAMVITLTAHRVRTWLLIPLVPLIQANALWAVFDGITINVQWWAALSFLLVLAWWELPSKADEEWQLIYRGSGILMTIFLLVFAYWLPAPTHQTMLSTWSAGALLVTYLGIRHRSASLIPLALAMLTGSVFWGLPAAWWSAASLMIGIGTLVFIEYLAKVDTHQLAMKLSIALAILLTGFAALLAVLLPILGVSTLPAVTVMVLFSSALLLGWIGWRGSISTAIHAALWLMASGWGTIYLKGFSDGLAFGLWLSVLAAGALVIEILLTSLRKQKRKMLYSIQETVLRWPLADLIIGLTAIIVVWAAINITVVAPLVLAVTLLIVVGIWINAGLIYRLPVLLHMALWIAPLPYALLLLVTVPGLRSVSMMALAWQVLAVGYVLLGHLIPKYRPAMLAPFFVAGYALLGFGITLTLANPVLLLVSLGIVIMVSFATSLAVIVDEHPAWSTLVAWMIPPEEKPYAYKHVHNLFLFLAAWLMVIWLRLMLDYAAFPVARQGIVLVLLSSVWIVIGRILPRFPGMVGLPVYGAGWFMWLIGLLQVFFAPTEAIIAAIIGLALSGEALNRSKDVYWMPVFVIQIMFSCLEVAWLLELPAHGFLLAIGTAFTLLGLWRQQGIAIEVLGGGLALAIWIIRPDLPATLVMLVLSVAAVWRYRRWGWLLPVYGWTIWLGIEARVHPTWHILLALAAIQLAFGSYLVKRLRGREYRTLESILYKGDWGAPFLWFGLLTAGLSLLAAFRQAETMSDLIEMLFAVGLLAALSTIWWRIPHIPTAAIGFSTTALLLDTLNVTYLPFELIADRLSYRGLLLVGLGLGAKVFTIYATRQLRPFGRGRWLVWWIRPTSKAGTFLAVIGFSIGAVATVYQQPPYPLFILNSVVVAALCWLIFIQVKHIRWAGAALVFAAAAWSNSLTLLHLTHPAWLLLPSGAVVMLLVRQIKLLDIFYVELSGIGLMLLAGISDMETGIMSWGTILIVATLGGLLAYGYLDGRRIPFFAALCITVGGIFIYLVQVSPWLVPLLLGIILITGVLIVETQKQHIETYYMNWRQRVSQWH